MTRRGMRMLVAVAVVVAALAALLPGQGRAASPEQITIGILAYRPAEEIRAGWEAFSAHLEARLETVDVTLVVGDFATLNQHLRRNDLDFILTGPSHYIQIRAENALSGVLATLSLRDDAHEVAAFGGVAFTLSERSDITSWEDLQNATVAAALTESVGAYQAQSHELWRRGITLSEQQVLLTGLPQDQVVDAVLEGAADVGFVRSGLLEALIRAGQLDADRIRILEERDLPGHPYAVSTRLYPEMAFVALPHVTPDLARRVAASLMSLGPEIGVVYGDLGVSFGIPADYAPIETLLRDLRLPPFDTPPRITWHDIWQQYGLALGVGAASFVALLVLTLGLLLLNRSLHRARDDLSDAVDALRRSEGRLRSVVEALPDMLFRVDRDGRFLDIHVDDARLLVPAGEAIGKTLADILPPSVADQALRSIRATLADGRITEMEYRLTLATGPGDFEARVVRLSEGEALVIARDVTERQRMRRELVRHAEELERLAEVSAHHLQEPTRRILSYAGLIRRRLGPLAEGPEVGFAFDFLQQEAVRLKALVRDVQLHLAADTGHTHGTADDARRVRDRIIQETATALADIGATLTFPDLPAIPLDAGRLHSVLSILVANAIRHRDPSRLLSITVGVGEDGDGVRLTVADNGPGISEPYRERVFWVFEQLVPPAEPDSTGIGLSIVRRVMDSVGGQVRIEDAPGGGCAVVLWFSRQQPSTADLSQF